MQMGARDKFKTAVPIVKVERTTPNGCGGIEVYLSCGHMLTYHNSPPMEGDNTPCPLCDASGDGASLAELEAARIAAGTAIGRLERAFERIQGEMRKHELRLDANQRTMRLMIALSTLIDEAGEKREVFWEHGLVSREQYDALAREFNQIGIPARLSGCKWTERGQSKEALLEILREYREACGR